MSSQNPNETAPSADSAFSVEGHPGVTIPLYGDVTINDERTGEIKHTQGIEVGDGTTTNVTLGENGEITVTQNIGDVGEGQTIVGLNISGNTLQGSSGDSQPLEGE